MCVENAFACNDGLLLSDAAVAGLGVAMLPLMAVWQELEAGRLVRVLGDEPAAEARVAVVYPEREFVPAAVRAFVDAVVAWAPDEFARHRSFLERCKTHGSMTAAPKKQSKKALQKKTAA